MTSKPRRSRTKREYNIERSSQSQYGQNSVSSAKKSLSVQRMMQTSKSRITAPFYIGYDNSSLLLRDLWCEYSENVEEKQIIEENLQFFFEKIHAVTRSRGHIWCFECAEWAYNNGLLIQTSILSNIYYIYNIYQIIYLSK